MNFKNFISKYKVVDVINYPNNVMSNPLISVCIQTYQHEEFIEKCINSILSQKTNIPFEILIGEDDSSDKTREICINYAKKFPRKIRLFLHDQKNNILIDNYKTGRFNLLYNLFSARGKFLALCDGDDYWIDNNKLNKQLTLIKKSRFSAVVSNFYYLKNGFFSERVKFKNQSGEKYFKINLNKIKKEDYHQKTHLSTFFFHKRILIKLFNHNWICKSWGIDTLLIPIFFEIGDVCYSKEKMSVYRINNLGLSRTKIDGYGGINRYKSKQFEKLKIIHPKYLKFINYREKMNTITYFCRTVDLFFFTRFSKALIYFLWNKNFKLIKSESYKIIKTILRKIKYI